MRRPWHVPIYLYYDLTCQDLAPEFEDRHKTFFAEGSGSFMQLVAWFPARLQTDVRRRCLASACALHTVTRPEPLLADEPTPSSPSRICMGVTETAEVSASTSLCFHLIEHRLAVRQIVSGNAHGLSPSSSRQCESSSGPAAWSRVRPGRCSHLPFTCGPSHTYEHSLCPNLSASSPPRSAQAPTAIYSKLTTRSAGSSQV